MGPNVHVRDTETGAEYFVSERRFKNPPKKGLWVRLDQGKPKTSVSAEAAKKRAAKKTAAPRKRAAAKKAAAAQQAKSGHQADSNQEES